jgi:pimeloyl-ACP methyl ester carboxylesterase
MERDGLVEGEEHGLFEHDRACSALKRCGPRSLKRSDRPIVFVHGMGGGKESFAAYLRAFAAAPEARGRRLLAFRYPGNGSLARAARLLDHELRRAGAAPERVAFVCHSAGGLVVRYYAEVLRGGLEQAHLLGVPHRGSNLTGLKFLVDLSDFVGELPGGLGPAVAHAVAEGRGEIAHDLHPDSLFLRHLARGRPAEGRYHVYYGEYLSRRQALALQLAFRAAKRLLRDRWVNGLGSPVLKRQALRWLGELYLPAEVLRGDLIVSTRSAALPGRGPVTKTGLHHQALRTDEALMRRVLAEVTAAPN